MKNPTEHPLKQIEGRCLSSVEFVQDYVQLRFDGPTLSAITRPTVKLGDIQLEWGTPKYRDALCERIGRVVRLVTVNENRGIFLGFDDGSSISISLNPEDRRAEEAVIFSDGTEEWDTW
jgi:hypothetical protein